MVLGLIDFLLGGKKKTQLSKSGKVATPQNRGGVDQQFNGAGNGSANANNLPDGVNTTTANNSQFDNSSNNSQVQQNNPQTEKQEGNSPAPVRATNPVASNNSAGTSAPIGKSSVSDAINKLHTELKSSGERVTSLVTDFKNLENSVNEMTHRVDALEEHKKHTDDKLSEMDENMTKFLSLYELINNQYNPFVDKDAIAPVVAKPMVVEAGGNSSGSESDSTETSETPDFNALKPGLDKTKNIDVTKGDDLDSVLLELDTLDIEEAAADAVPLTSLNNNTNSLVVILSWLEYLIKRVGLDETRNSLRYYTEVLRWITPEVYFELDKYLRGMKDVDVEAGTTLGVRDHIVSLYFISKLNKKQLDQKLTSAVLQIIKN